MDTRDYQQSIPSPQHHTREMTPKEPPTCQELYSAAIALIRQHTVGTEQFHHFLYDEVFQLILPQNGRYRLVIRCNRNIAGVWKREGIAQMYTISEQEDSQPLWEYTISGTGLPISFVGDGITCIARSLQKNNITYNEQNAYKIAQTSIEYAEYIAEQYKKSERLHTRGRVQRQKRNTSTIDTNGDGRDISRHRTQRI